MAASRFRKQHAGEEEAAGAAEPEKNASGPEARVPWRSPPPAATESSGQEASQEVLAFRLQLTLASAERDPGRARALLSDMAAARCPPGPQEYHLAAAGYALAGDVDGVLDVMEEQHKRGGLALLETCARCWRDHGRMLTERPAGTTR